MPARAERSEHVLLLTCQLNSRNDEKTDQRNRAPMLLVSRKEQESPEALIRRFNKMVQRDGVLQEARRRRRFISNREKQRQAERRAARRRRRAMVKVRRPRMPR